MRPLLQEIGDIADYCRLAGVAQDIGEPGGLGDVFEPTVRGHNADQLYRSLVMRDPAANGIDEAAAQPRRKRPLPWKELAMAGSRPLASRPPDGVSALYSMICQCLVHRAGSRSDRTGSGTAAPGGELDGGPGRQRRHVGVVKNAVHGQIEQLRKLDRDYSELIGFGS